MNISIIIPVYKEGENIISTLNEICKINHFQNITILICFDFDEDETLNVIKTNKFHKKLNIVFVKNSGERGPHSAVMSGLKFKSSFDYYIVLPADDDYNVQNFPLIFKLLKLQKPDIICMSRFIKGGGMHNGPLIKTAIMRIVNYFLKYVAMLPTSDATNGFRIFSNRVISNIEIKTKKGFTYSLEYLIKSHKAEYKIIEFPAKWKERKFGKSRFKINSWAFEYIKLCLLSMMPKSFFK